MHLAKVAVAGMEIDKGDGHIDILTASDNDVNLAKSVSVNDPMVLAICSMGFQNEVALNAVYEGNVVFAKEAGLDVLIQVACDGMGIDKADGYSQCEPSTLNALIEGFDSQNNNPGIDFLQHDDHVDCSVAKPYDHPTADIGVKPVHNEFVDDFMDVLNDEKSLPKAQSNKSDYVNVVTDDYKPCLASVFAQVKKERKKSDMKTNYVLRSAKERKKRLAMALESSFGQQPPTTLVAPKRISRSVNCDFILPLDLKRSINELLIMEVFVEQLSRLQNCKKDKVSLPDGLAEYLQMKDPPNYRFPWGYRDIPVDREFWLVLACLDRSKQGWLKDSVDILWCFRQPDMVYFLVNEPKRHWCLAELHITTGVVTFYDSLGWVCSKRRLWWRNMKRTLPQQLTLYLNEHEVLQSKDIAVERYEITYKFPTVIDEADLYGDCVKSLLQFRNVSKSWKSYIDSTAFFFNYGVRKSVNDVFYLTYNHGRLGYMIYVDANLIHTPSLANLHVSNLKPVGTSNGILCFSYGNNMMVCITNPSIGKKVGVFVPTSKPDGSKILLGFGVCPDNLDPTVLKFSYPSSGEGNWSVHVFTLSALRWYQLDMNRLPRESIRFKRSTQAIVGEYIYWANVYADVWTRGLMCYVDLAKRENEGTVTDIDTDDEGCFKMYFIGFGVAIKIFLCYMRSLIIIDAAHLKETYLGTNLVAVSMDGNNQIIHIATGVSQGKIGESWTWFLRKLKVCIGEVPNLTIISDRHYAITLACNIVFPNSFNGYCCRHLMMNCGIQSNKYKELYWNTCKAYTVQDFEKLMTGIHVVRPDAHQKLIEAGVEKWSRAKCPANKYNYMTMM
uniref:Transposase, MuDR, MULE transposase domain protein n=1 Tax=Tanacetum cinerariifolium TaxID=118510 RepID=A0A6L2KYY2_TANCI|nr:transposase, MuDR, MULE transposase domain protein [Tanacetum cinerariifolium]